MDALLTTLVGLVVAALSAFLGKLYAHKRYNDGYTEGAIDQNEQMRRETERARSVIDAEDERARQEAAAKKRIAETRAARLLGHKPTDAELAEFLRDAE